MINILRFIVTFLGFAVVLTLAVLNRGDVAFLWSPLHGPVHMPVMMIVLVGVALGFFWGTIMHWIHNAPARVTARANVKTIKDLTERLQQSEQAMQTHDVMDDEPAAAKKGWWRRRV